MTKKPTALVTSGPTREKIDPVRFISNFSSGKQGQAVAAALYAAGFDVTLISGPVNLKAPEGVKTIYVESAAEMLASCIDNLPVDVAVCVAAVADFRPAEFSAIKIKKSAAPDSIKLLKNPDILQSISTHKLRPKIVVGFAAETENLIINATKKLHEKKCDIIVANNVKNGAIFGQDATDIKIVTHLGVESLSKASKLEAAEKLTTMILNLL